MLSLLTPKQHSQDVLSLPIEVSHSTLQGITQLERQIPANCESIQCPIYVYNYVRNIVSDYTVIHYNAAL